MASAAEQLAANLNLGVLSKATELKRRIWFTLGALIVYRIGTYIPVPGVDASVMSEMLSQHGGGILGMFDMFTGGALRRSVFADRLFGRYRECPASGARRGQGTHSRVDELLTT